MKAVLYYKEALGHSTSVSITHKTMYLHEKIAECLMENQLTRDEAKMHLKEYNILRDSLERNNKMVTDFILNEIISDKDVTYAQRSRSFRNTVIGIILASIIIGTILIIRNLKSRKKLNKKSEQLIYNNKKIGSLEEELENNIFQDIIELAKSNSPEFLPLFGEGYPEFIEAMKKLDPNIRSSELYFCALAYLNFSTKDIATFTFVTPRAVQVRRNRMRKKYNILSEVDFNEWFRSLGNGDVSVN